MKMGIGIIDNINSRRLMGYGLFISTCLFSSLTLFPSFSSYRYPYFERYLDVFFVLFFLSSTFRNHDHKLKVKPSLIFAIFTIFCSSLFAAFNFGSTYFFIEYRQYIILFFVFFLSLVLKRSLDPDFIWSTLPIYLLFIFVNFGLGIIYSEYYRPGVFGEANYDLAYMAVIVLSGYFLRGAAYNPILLMIVFSVFSQSRTAIFATIILSIIKIRTFRGIVTFLIITLAAIQLFLSRLWLDDQGDFLSSVLQIDRLQMVIAYLDAVSSEPLLAVFGQAFSGRTFFSPIMAFYADTQVASQLLGFNTPSNFHGHLIRGFLLMGPLIYIIFLMGFLKQASVSHTRPGFVFILIIMVATGLSQSILSHPFSGSFFAFSCLCGFVSYPKSKWRSNLEG